MQRSIRLISISTRVRRYCPKPCWCPLWIGCKLTCVCVVSDRSAISATTIVALKEPGLEQAFDTCQRGDRRVREFVLDNEKRIKYRSRSGAPAVRHGSSPRRSRWAVGATTSAATRRKTRGTVPTGAPSSKGSSVN